MRAVVALYAVLVVVSALYGFFWSDYAFKGAGWILARAVFWPVAAGEYAYDLAKAAVKFVVGITVLLGFLWFVMSRR